MSYRLTFSVLLIAALAGCTNEHPATALSDAAETEHESLHLGASKIDESLTTAQIRQLAELRRLVAPFHNFDKAMEAGWNQLFTPCLSNPAEGGMGIHYLNPAHDDAEANLLEPELLIYEPQKNGKLRFVGVEYIIRFTELGPESDAPTLLGQEFHQVPAAGLWGLHMWVGRHNPSGMFADWNPLVTCEHAGG